MEQLLPSTPGATTARDSHPLTLPGDPQEGTRGLSQPRTLRGLLWIHPEGKPGFFQTPMSTPRGFQVIIGDKDSRRRRGSFLLCGLLRDTRRTHRAPIPVPCPAPHLLGPQNPSQTNLEMTDLGWPNPSDPKTPQTPKPQNTSDPKTPPRQALRLTDLGWPNPRCPNATGGACPRAQRPLPSPSPGGASGAALGSSGVGASSPGAPRGPKITARGHRGCSGAPGMALAGPGRSWQLGPAPSTPLPVRGSCS